MAGWERGGKGWGKRVKEGMREEVGRAGARRSGGQSKVGWIGVACRQVGCMVLGGNGVGCGWFGVLVVSSGQFGAGVVGRGRLGFGGV